MGALNATPLLIAVVGPTASGKSALGLALAERFNGEIVNYDSVQLYRGCDIGSGKLAPGERLGIPHHLLDCADPSETVTAGDYARQATRVLNRLAAQGKTPVLVGGTGLYLRALLDGLFEAPARSEPLRARLRAVEERRGSEFLHRMLRRLDGPAAGLIAPQDLQKVIRALEVCLVSRQPISRLQARGRNALQGFRSLKIGLNPPRELLYGRINRRTERMFSDGLLEEVSALSSRRESPRPKPLEALGYRQASEHLQGRITLAEAIRLTQRETRRYAKRQMTWFRREPGVIWFLGFGDDPNLQQAAFERIQGDFSAADSARPLLA